MSVIALDLLALAGCIAYVGYDCTASNGLQPHDGRLIVAAVACLYTLVVLVVAAIQGGSPAVIERAIEFGWPVEDDNADRAGDS